MKRRNTTKYSRAAALAGLLAATLAPCLAPGQGTINFSDFVSGVVFSHIYAPQATAPFNSLTGNIATAFSRSTPYGDFPTGTTTYQGPLLGGSGTGPTNALDFTNGFLWTAQLWASGGADLPGSSLYPMAQYTTTLRTGPTEASAGFITPVSFTESNPDPGILYFEGFGGATCQLRVWYNGGGTITSWDSALESGVPMGVSATFTINGPDFVAGLPPMLPLNLAGLQSFSIYLPYQSVPPALQSATVDQAGGTFNIVWSAPPGQVCQVQFKTNLSQSGWVNLGPLTTVTNGTVRATEILSTSQSFYRMVVQP
jgi:hypothetical protein